MPATIVHFHSRASRLESTLQDLASRGYDVASSITGYEDQTKHGGFADVRVGLLDARSIENGSTERRTLEHGQWREWKSESSDSAQERSDTPTSAPASSDGDGVIKVAVKCFRVHTDAGARFTRSVHRELRLWVDMDHPNVLPLIGFIDGGNGSPSLVSEWMSNGTITSYLRSNCNVDKLKMVIGVAEGLRYLHTNDIIHSDLKSDNILVAADGSPQITDFGISRIMIESQCASISNTSQLQGSIRWMAPELLQPNPIEDEAGPSRLSDEAALHTKASDMWAFGMVICEIITGKLPYAEIHREAQVMLAIMNYDLPVLTRDTSMSDADYHRLCAACIECWRKSPLRRPNAKAIIERLRYSPQNVLTLQKSIHNDLDQPLALAFTPDGSRVATLHVSGPNFMNIFIWNLRNNTRENHISVLFEDEGEVCLNALAYGCDGKYVAVGVNNARLKEGFVMLVDTTVKLGQTRRVRRLEMVPIDSVESQQIKPEELTSFAFSPNGLVLAGVFRTKLVQWTLNSVEDSAGRIINIPNLIGGEHITSVAYSDDASQLICTTHERVVVCDLDTGNWDPISTEGDLSRASVTLRHLDRQNRWVLAQYQSTPRSSFGFYSDSNLFALFNYEAGSLVKGPFLADRLVQPVASPRGGLVAASTDSCKIEAWDLSTGGYLGGTSLGSIDSARFRGTKVKCMDFSPTGQHLVCGLWDGRVLIYRTCAERTDW